MVVDKTVLNTLEKVVKEVLESDPTTRDDNFKLYAKVVIDICGIKNSNSFIEVMFNHSQYDLPPMESVTRTRRAVVNKFPELSSSAQVKDFRKSQEKEYAKYSKGV